MIFNNKNVQFYESNLLYDKKLYYEICDFMTKDCNFRTKSSFYAKKIGILLQISVFMLSTCPHNALASGFGHPSSGCLKGDAHYGMFPQRQTRLLSLNVNH